MKLSAELGVNSRTVSRWLRGAAAATPAARPAFRRVEFVAAPQAPKGGLVVHGPGDLWVEGLNVGGVIALWRALL